MSLIHPSAIIEDGAQIDPSVRIGAFSIVESGAVIGPGCVIESGARIYAHTRMGRNNSVGHGATIGSAPQDLSYTPDRARPLTIGDGNRFGEYANISHGVKEPQGTVIGDGNFFMAFSHVGHDCVVGSRNVLANTALLSGHVRLGDRAFLSGHVAVHQFCRIGDLAMVAGLTGVRQDVPPYAMVNGPTARFVGLNLVGLRRAGVDQARRSALKRAYRILLQSGQSLSSALAQVKAGIPGDDVLRVVEFIETSQRGVVAAD